MCVCAGMCVERVGASKKMKGKRVWSVSVRVCVFFFLYGRGGLRGSICVCACGCAPVSTTFESAPVSTTLENQTARLCFVMSGIYK